MSDGIVAAISMLEDCKCVLAYYEHEGWRIDAINENGDIDGSLKLCRTGIDLDAMSKKSRKRASKKGDVPRVTSSDFKEADDHGRVTPGKRQSRLPKAPHRGRSALTAGYSLPRPVLTIG